MQNNKFNIKQEIGILDPTAKNYNPLTGKNYTNRDEYRKLGNIWSSFPVYKQRQEFIKGIAENQVILITAGTGSGKTVLIPKYALHTYGYDARIAITNPKQIPTASSAKFAAATLDVKLGEEVGYRFKGDRMVDRGSGKKSKLVFTTDGYITAKIMGDDPVLSDYNMIIIDEAHERNVQIDFMLLFIRRALLKRPDLKLIIMSATIDPKKFADYFPSDKFRFIHLEAPGKPNKKIEETFLDKPVNRFNKQGILANKENINAAVDKVVKIIKNDIPGNILVFLTSSSDGREACKLLRNKLKKNSINHRPFCVELHSKTKTELKEFAIGTVNYRTRNNGPWDRKVIMATEVAESSITFDDVIKHVIDCGLSLQENYYPQYDMDGLEKRYISKASHQQRKGRAGRQEDGYCHNIFTKKEYEKIFPEYTPPPILRSDLFEPIFKIMSSEYVSHSPMPFKYTQSNGSKNIKNSTNTNTNKKVSLDVILGELLDVPSSDTVNMSLMKLFVLELLSKNKNTLIMSQIGKQVSELRMHPGYGRMMLEPILKEMPKDVLDNVLQIIAMLEASQGNVDTFFYIPTESDFRGNTKEYLAVFNQYNKVRKKMEDSKGDHWTLLKIYQIFDKKKQELLNKYNGKNIGKAFKELEKWCEKYFLRYHILNRINKEYLGTYRDRLKEYPTSKKMSNNSSSKMESINQCLLAGHRHHLAKKNKNEWIPILPPKQKGAKIDRNSSMKSKTAKYVIYDSYMNDKLILVSKMDKQK